MVILILERVPPGLRGELSRWMIEPHAGVFVGNVSALVRDKLWDKVGAQKRGGAAVLIHSARNEQGFQVRTHGVTSRQQVEWEGLALVQIPGAPPRRRQASPEDEKADEEVTEAGNANDPAE